MKYLGFEEHDGNIMSIKLECCHSFCVPIYSQKYNKGAEFSLRYYTDEDIIDTTPCIHCPECDRVIGCFECKDKELLKYFKYKLEYQRKSGWWLVRDGTSLTKQNIEHLVDNNIIRMDDSKT